MDAPAGGTVITLQQPACSYNCFQKVFVVQEQASDQAKRSKIAAAQDEEVSE